MRFHAVIEGGFNRARSFFMQELFPQSKEPWLRRLRKPGRRRTAAESKPGRIIAELARLAATSRSLIHAYENGTVSPSVARAQTLLDHLNHTLSVTPKNP